MLPQETRLADEPSRDALLERLDRIGEGAALRLAEQQMDVLGHHDVSEDAQFASTPDSFQRGHNVFFASGELRKGFADNRRRQ